MATNTISLNGKSAGRGTRRREPAWEIATMYPAQGDWTEEDYLALEANGAKRMMELVDGFLEFLPMPDPLHQRIVGYSYRRLHAYGETSGAGEALLAPCPIRLWPGQLREPDIFFVKAHRVVDARRPPDGADLVMEIPSPGTENRERDFVVKRRAYAKAKIPEYWIIDPETETITVHTLAGTRYKTHGVFKAGQQATSKLLPGFTLDVAAVFAAGRGKK